MTTKPSIVKSSNSRHHRPSARAANQSTRLHRLLQIQWFVNTRLLPLQPVLQTSESRAFQMVSRYRCRLGSVFVVLARSLSAIHLYKRHSVFSPSFYGVVSTVSKMAIFRCYLLNDRELATVRRMLFTV